MPQEPMVISMLYVEDNDDNNYLLKRRFARAGFTLVIARDGEQGLAAAQAERPDLILILAVVFFAGTFGLFLTLFMLFIRYLPMMALSEIKGVTPSADPHGEHGDAHGHSEHAHG